MPRKFVYYQTSKLDPTIIEVFNHKAQYLGYINWIGFWKVHKQFVFNPDNETFFTSSCLKEITEKLESLNMSVAKKSPTPQIQNKL